jgi:riboflavin kinase
MLLPPLFHFFPFLNISLSVPITPFPEIYLTPWQEVHIMPPLSLPSPTAVDADNGTAKHGLVTFYKMPDFYSTKLNLLILGYIRPEYDYISREALVEDIRIDCEVSRSSLARKAYLAYLQEEDSDDVVASDPQVKEQRNWLRCFS